MSLAQDYLDRWLKCDVESYLRGHEPRPIELELAPRLESWRVDLARERTETPSLIVLKEAMLLTGQVSSHPKHTDGEPIETARLVWLDRSEKWVRTRDRLYRLGRRSNPESQEPVE